MTYKEIVDKIISLLKADVNLSEPDKIAKYYFGAPVRVTVYPFIYVQWTAQEPTGRADINRFLYDLTFEIGVVDRSVVEDEAEKSVYDKVEAITSVLEANPTLDGLVVKEEEPISVDVVRASERDYAVAYARITFPRRVWMNAF